MSVTFAVLGTTFPIIEMDIKDMLMARMKMVDMAKAQKEVQDRVKESVRNPKPIFENARCVKPRTWTYDPTVTLDRDIVDNEGVVLVAKGAVHNPLQGRIISKQLVFIEGRDSEQVEWALQQSKAKIVLVNGSPLDLEEQHQVPIYFDQNAHLCTKLGITAFPARAYQEGDKLRCEEIALYPKNPAQDPGVVMEVKFNKTATAALEQVEDKAYYADLKAHGCTTVRTYGLAFDGKNVEVVMA